MGNTTSKIGYHNNQSYTSQCSLGDLIGGSCTRLTPGPNRIPTSWSRASYRSYSEHALNDPLSTSKTLWPMSRAQTMFLPEFPIKQVPLQEAYTILNVIARGAYGKVYKIQKQDTGQYFALKIISKAKVVAENDVTQAKQEVAIQSLVGHHPFILDCSHRWQGKKTLYILTDFIGGGELFSLVEQGGCLPENVARIYVAEVALAIDFLHNAGVIHRDIKATNVLLDEEGHAVIIDFGFAKWLSYKERTNTVCGTPEYMAPEILKGQYYGQEVDWWSLGVLACFLLTDQYPVGGTSEYLPQSRQNRNDAAPGTLPSNAENISPAAEDLLKRLLQPDPRLRLKSLLSLQRIAFFMGHNLHSYMEKKESPFRLLGRKVETEQEKLIREISNFDSFLGENVSRGEPSISKDRVL